MFRTDLVDPNTLRKPMQPIRKEDVHFHALTTYTQEGTPNGVMRITCVNPICLTDAERPDDLFFHAYTFTPKEA